MEYDRIATGFLSGKRGISTAALAATLLRCLLGRVSHDLEKQVLKGVSRSFYLSLRLLPVPMRDAASLGYLIARTSDTLADTDHCPTEIRLKALEQYQKAVSGEGEPPRWPHVMLNALTDRRERRLLESAVEIIAGLRSLPRGKATLVKEVVTTIISGQILDLQRFSTATKAEPVTLPDEAALEDYAWRVAGSVGEFWTKLGLHTLGSRFSTADPEWLVEKGIAYGKGLQLVNILRDLPQDLAAGRCYLPVADPTNRAELLDCHARWSERARVWIEGGISYSHSLPMRRLRASSLLPAKLALGTLDQMRGATWDRLASRIKIPRHRVYASLWASFWSSPRPGV